MQSEPRRIQHKVSVTMVAVALAALSVSRVGGYDFIWNDTRYNSDIQMRLNLTTSWSITAAKMMRQWNRKAFPGTGIRFRWSQTSATPSRNLVNEVAMDSTAWGSSFGSSTLGVAILTGSGTRLTEGDVIFNSAYTWHRYRGDFQSGKPAEFRRVALHEFGHVLGLGHELNKSSIMNPYVGDIYELQSDDIAGVQALYGSNSGGGGDDDCNPSALIGAPVRGDLENSDCLAPHRRNRRADLYVFTGSKQDRVRISLRKKTLNDPYLVLVDPSGRVEARDDNGRGGKDAWISTRLKKSGTYTIEATARGKSHRGSYILRCKRC